MGTGKPFLLFPRLEPYLLLLYFGKAHAGSSPCEAEACSRHGCDRGIHLWYRWDATTLAGRWRDAGTRERVCVLGVMISESQRDADSRSSVFHAWLHISGGRHFLYCCPESSLALGVDWCFSQL
ncbi:hypothetical protein EYF80_058140 [Liparis tanakae]|uniref:Secreted protein n=1 Tax=Liparis tanakae TaxID=230148 RepID=A0A4Z2ETV1_9TELE|nr:hypothetical protein EYF80_058140 [Liparis tanakae]